MKYLQFILDNWEGILAAAFVGLAVMKAFCRFMKWDKGLLLADELLQALQPAAKYVMRFRQEGGSINIEKAAKTVAAHVAGVNYRDIQAVIAMLAKGKAYENRGVKITMSDGGEVAVDASGFITGKVRKISRWLKNK